MTTRGSLHHVELQVRDLDQARLYADRHPFAGGPDHRAAFLEDGERFKIELVAET